MMKVAFVQTDCLFNNPEANLATAQKRNAPTPSDRIGLPTPVHSGYQFTGSDERKKLAKPISVTRVAGFFMDLARKKSTFMVAGVVENV